MRRAIFLVVTVLAIVMVAPIAGRALTDRVSEALSRTREFSIDGRTFRVKVPAADGLSLVERELSKRGVDVFHGATDFPSALDPGAIEALDEGPAAGAAPALPPGLHAEHVMTLGTGSGPVEIALGRLTRGEKDILARLRSSGWECRNSGAPGTIAHATKGREASVVVLEKDTGRFLAIRRAVR